MTYESIEKIAFIYEMAMEKEAINTQGLRQVQLARQATGVRPLSSASAGVIGTGINRIKKTTSTPGLFSRIGKAVTGVITGAK